MPHDYVVADFETFSACEIKTAGAEKYAEDATTGIHCLGYKFPQRAAQLWKPDEREPAELIDHVAAGRPVIVHNGAFEYWIWRLVLRLRGYGAWPELTIKQIDDTMPRARALSLPGALDACCEALRLPIRKDQDGYRAMLKLARPRKRDPLTWWTPETAPDDYAKLYNYCPIDCDAGEQLHLTLPPLTPEEREIWELDQIINNRGVQLDMANVRRALTLLTEEKAELSARVFKKTNEATTATQRDALLAWLQSEGVELASLTKAEVARALADPKLNGTLAKEVLEMRREAAKVSTTKLNAMVKSACADGRARGLFQFHGAATGRWAGRRIQTQNMPRPAKHFKPQHAADAIDWLRFPNAGKAIRFEYGSAMDALSWALRSFICAQPGHKLIAADFSNIEGRVLAWLAGEEWKLDAFRRYDMFMLDENGQRIPDGKGDYVREGHDLYVLAFARAFGMQVEDVDDARRQVGKVMELALGYSGGIGSFISMGANYGVVPDHISTATRAITSDADWEATMKRLPGLGSRFRAGLEPDVWCGLRIVVDAWRAAHPNVVAFWKALEAAAIEATEYPGRVTRVGMIRYRKEGDFLKCKLPSGRCISYPYAAMKKFPSMSWEAKRDELRHREKELLEPEHIDQAAWSALMAEQTEHEKNVEWQSGLTYWGVSSKAGSSKKWKQQRAYGGLLAENVTQATARDCLAYVMPQLEAAGYSIVMHVHDEILCEVPENFGSVSDFASKMCAQKQWAEGLPIAAAGYEAFRYRK
jgi:DNA polymerase